MIEALRAEWRKTMSTRMWWVLLLVMALYVALFGGFFAFSIASEGTGIEPRDAAQQVYSLVNSIGYVFPLVIGTLLLTGEFRYKTITGSLLVQPNRSIFLGAKLLGAVPLGLLYGVLGTGAMLAAAAPMLATRGDGAFLGDPKVIASLIGCVVVLMLWTVIGVAIGSVIPNQVAAIVVVLAVTQFVEPITRVALTGLGAEGVAKFLPVSAADAVIGASVFASISGGDSSALLSRWAGLAVLVLYAVGLALIGRFVTLRRDIG